MFKPRFGIEFTFVEGKSASNSAYEAAIKLRKCRGLRKAHDDQGALEIPTPILNSVAEAECFYKHCLMPRVSPLGFVARRVDKLKDGSELYHGTGGGHIHVELPKKRLERNQVMVNLIRLISDRPWLTWVFNEFMDDENSRALISCDTVRELINGDYKIGLSGYPQEEEDPMFSLLSTCGGKSYALRFHYEYKTVEFRFFDAPRSWAQTKSHLEFALALYKHAKLSETHHYSTYYKESDVDKSKAGVRRDFKATVLMLGLKWKDYAPYMKNFDDRVLYGKLN